MNDSIKIDFTLEFKRAVKDLGKRYPNIRLDLETVLKEIERGVFVGDRVSGVGQSYFILKLRVKNRDIKKGKRAGYRLIYRVDSPHRVLLLTLYSKSDREDISAEEILQLLKSV